MDSAGTALLEAGLCVELAYLQSDEITLLIPEGRVPFDGRVEKLCSTFSALASVDFSRHLDLNASFDCRVLHLSYEEDALSMLIHWTLIQKRGMTAKQAHKFLKSLKHPQRVELSIELGVPFQELEDGRLMGRTIVYVPHLHQGYNPITKETVQVYRRRVQKLGSCPDFALCDSLPWHVKGPDSK
jgi:tRNA(His) 5'-end guanylyltransferase